MLYFWGRYFWALALAISIVNAATTWVRSRADVSRDPELGPGYTKLVIGILTWANIPWLVMGYGVMVGGVPSIWYYFRPQDRDPYVLAWFASIFLLWMLGTVWIYAWGGADMLARHTAGFRGRAMVSSAKSIKAVWALSLAGGVAGFVFMLLMDVPLESLPLR